MSRFLQLHLLTAYPAANLNRDDTGRPKTLMFGGAERIRVSSQSLKRAFRTSEVFHEKLPGALGKRSQQFARDLVDALIASGMDPEEATKRAGGAVNHDSLGKLKTDKAETEQLVHLGPEEQAAFTALAARLSVAPQIDEKTMLTLVHKPRAVDIAMFGRMLADNPAYNVEAAVQVAHAFTTHRVAVEDDYYVAVDELKAERTDADKGAGFIGVQEFGGGLFYLYICIDGELLADNLSGDMPLAGQAVDALITAAATVSPRGKQNAFASRAKAEYLLLETGVGQPRTLGGAFQKPVRPGDDEDLGAASIRALQDLRAGFERAYAETFTSTVMDVRGGQGSLAEVLGVARSAIGC